MIHTFTVSYELSLKDANTCTYRLQERTQAFKGQKYRITNFLNVDREFGRLIFKVPEFPGIKNITLLKITDRNEQRIFRIYFQIEAEILRTGVDTLDLFFCSPEHARELQIQYAKVIYSLFPEAFMGRPASHLATSDFAELGSYAPEEYINGENNNGHGGMYSLPYLPLGSVNRIDFTYDNVLPDEEHAKLFTEMLSKSYYDGWKKKIYVGQNKNKDSKEKSNDRAYASGRKAFSIYYKYDKMMSEEYDNRPNIAQIREDSRNVVRIEMPIKSPGRGMIKRITSLNIPVDVMTLGPLPYLATEQASAVYVFNEFIDRVGNAHDLKWYTREELDKQVNRKIKAITRKRKNKKEWGNTPIWEKQLTKHKGEKIKKLSADISKRGSIQKYITELKKYQEKRAKDKEKYQNEEKKFPTLKTFRDYRKLAIQNGIMLATIPANRGIDELSAYLNLRNFDFSEVTWQLIRYMLPYHSITEEAPEMEPVKDTYDSIMEFLYSRYDQYNAEFTAMAEEAKRPPEEFGL